MPSIETKLCLHAKMVMALFAPFMPAYADAPPNSVRMDDVSSGSLLIATQAPGWYLAAPRVATDIQADVTGSIVRVRATQRFVNPTDQWVEATYVWPADPGAAIDMLRMMVGDRFIEGEIQEKGQARRNYEAARDEGRRAGLVAQSRPNVFSTAVANLGPGETAVVQIAYQQTAALQDGEWRLRIPTVVAPRFDVDAPPALQTVTHERGPDSRPVAQPAVVDPALTTDALISPLMVEVALKPGFTPAEVRSSYHVAEIEPLGESWIVRLPGFREADRDFELTWSAADEGTVAELFHETTEAGVHYLVQVNPGAVRDEGEAPPRDLIIVQDVSGSMQGASIRQAKAALERALDALRPQDRFNIIAFSNGLEPFALSPLEASPEAIKAARAFVRNLQAGGGTVMAPALREAFDLTDTSSQDRLAQIVFVTDGAVGNEAGLFSLISERLGDARLFAVGIGSAPNAHFIKGASEMGRGAAVTIGDVSQVSARMDDLLAKLSVPVLTDLVLEGAEGGALFPVHLPDLYAGEPIAFSLRFDEPPQGALTLSGRRTDGAPWRTEMTFGDAEDGSGVAKLWARRKIADLESAKLRRARSATAVDEGVLDTALAYGLVSRRTSLVAVERGEIARPGDEALAQVQAPNALPAGWDFGSVFGEAANAFAEDRRASVVPLTPAPPLGEAASVPIRLAAAQRSVSLPSTGYDLRLQSMFGLLMVVLASAAIRFGWRRAA